MDNACGVLITDQGRPVKEEDLAALEAQASAVLPGDYRAFLLSHNGGRPNPDCVSVPGLAGGDTDVKVFLGVDRPEETENIAWWMSEGLVPPGSLPVAVDSGSALFVIALRGRRKGAVLYREYGSKSVHRVASSFSAFLAALRSLQVGSCVVPPVFVWDPGDLGVFRSADEAARSLEAIDVKQGAYTAAFDARGQGIRLVVRAAPVRFLWAFTVWRERVELQPSGGERREEFARILRDLLQQGGRPKDVVARMSWEDLVAEALARA